MHLYLHIQRNDVSCGVHSFYLIVLISSSPVSIAHTELCKILVV